MAKRPFKVSDNEQPIDVSNFADDMVSGDDRLVRKFADKYGSRFPRLLAALRATKRRDDSNEN